MVKCIISKEVLDDVADVIIELCNLSHNIKLSSIRSFISDYIGDEVPNMFINGTIKDLIYSRTSSIRPYCLTGMSLLKTANFENAVNIGNNAFSSCVSLSAIYMPLVNVVGDNAFANCVSLSNIYMPLAISIGNNAFENCSSLSSVAFNSVTNLGDNAFINCTSLSNIQMSLAMSIGNNAFENCSSLTSIYFSVADSIGSKAFANCVSLSSIHMPLVMDIGDNAFENCISLSSVEFLNDVSIGKYAFAGCHSLSHISLNYNTSINSYAFYSCGVESLYLPLVTSIGTEAFRDCSMLASISLPVISNIEYGAFSCCSSLKSVNLSTVTVISDYAFAKCYHLSYVSLPEVTEIGECAFYLDDNHDYTVEGMDEEFPFSTITNILMPNVNYIGTSAFAYQKALTLINMPMVRNIKSYAFFNCLSLSSVYVLTSSVPLLGESVFLGTPIESVNGSIFVRQSLVDVFKTAQNWSDYASTIVGM